MNEEAPEVLLRQGLEAIAATLENGRQPELEAPLRDDPELVGLLGELAALYRFTLAISQGDLEQHLHARGNLAGALKSLQAALRHLTWQTQRVADGDFTQRVDFMGEFSRAFNTMVEKLDEARAELEEKNRLLEAQTVALEAQAVMLERLATTDALTGALNRRRFDELARSEIERVRRYGTPLSLLILDIDHFKRVNDSCGHRAGDDVLVALAGLIRGRIRTTDFLARWGGEEFVVLSPGVELPSFAALAERLRAAIAAHDFGAAGTVTASFGVTTHHSGEAADELFSRADQALYAAKEGGRDRVEVAG